ncbi:MAG: hypothetical protein MK116_12510 [Phycisphaerales bacterium]|nr:hypothetical protein [Phycisphaerales bacterium]
MFSPRRGAPLLAILIPLLALAQDAPPASSSDEAETGQDVPIARAPLLAEGTVISNAEGTMVPDERRPLWRFQLDRESPDAPERDFILLPCRVLQDMEQKARSIAPTPARFSLTGEVLSYGRDNWLLPQHVEWITEHAERNETTEVPPDPSEPLDEEPPTTPAETSDDPWADEAASPRDQGDSIADIVADLQSSVGPLRRSIDTGEDTVAPVAGPSEGRILVSRRGRLGRGRTGAWVFVLDSDVNGLSDPSLVLLPSRRLAQLETYAGYGWMGQPMLMSGEVFTYRDRHFLRPTSWKFVRERPNLIR